MVYIITGVLDTAECSKERDARYQTAVTVLWTDNCCKDQLSVWPVETCVFFPTEAVGCSLSRCGHLINARLMIIPFGDVRLHYVTEGAYMLAHKSVPVRTSGDVSREARHARIPSAKLLSPCLRFEPWSRLAHISRVSLITSRQQ